MKYIFDTEKIIKATETIKRYCEHQERERCKDCMFNTKRGDGSINYCAITSWSPSLWNFRKKEE